MTNELKIPPCPWPEAVWPTTLEEAYLREVLSPQSATAISGALMRQGWNLALRAVQELNEKWDDCSPCAASELGKLKADAERWRLAFEENNAAKEQLRWQCNQLTEERDSLQKLSDQLHKEGSDILTERDAYFKQSEAEIATLKARVADLIELLKVAKCPDENCDGKGSSWFANLDGAGESQQVQIQCQWCCERQETLARLGVKQ